MDIVERLRGMKRKTADDGADEIERLRAALTEIADLIDQVFARGLDPFLLGQVKGRVTQTLGSPAPPQR